MTSIMKMVTDGDGDVLGNHRSEMSLHTPMSACTSVGLMI